MACAIVLFFIILASLLRSIQGDTNADDMKALSLFFSSLNSPPELTGWNDSEGDPCTDSWKGITCDNDDGVNVTQIDLSGLMLNGSLTWSSPLSGLQNLIVLDLSNNQLKGLIPNSLPRKIEVLNLESNHLERSIPWSLGQMVNLTELRLAHNNLTGPITDNFMRMDLLITLDLSHNGFNGSIPTTFGNLSQLGFLYLQGNAIDSGLDVLTNLRSLQAVDIRDNAFHGESIPSQLWTLPNFQFSAIEFFQNASLPSNQGNVSLMHPPGALPPEIEVDGLQVHPPNVTSGTDIEDPESFSFWYRERVVGVSVVAVLAVVALVLILLICNWRQKEKERNRGDSDRSS
ncbi:unnamed protein product [Calypogeia fissa]